MVKDQAQIRMAIGEGDRIRQLALKNQDLIRKRCLFQTRNATIEVFTQNKRIIRFVLHDMTQRLQLRFTSKTLKVRGKICRGNRKPAGHTGDESMLRRIRQQHFRLRDTLPRFNGNDLIDAAVRDSRGKIRRTEIPTQRIRGDPAELLIRIAPEVMVRIDDHNFTANLQTFPGAESQSASA